MVLCTSNVIKTKTDLSSCLHHPFDYALFYVLKLPNVSNLLADSFS
jgi:hypothetical protein